MPPALVVLVHQSCRPELAEMASELETGRPILQKTPLGWREQLAEMAWEPEKHLPMKQMMGQLEPSGSGRRRPIEKRTRTEQGPLASARHHPMPKRTKRQLGPSGFARRRPTEERTRTELAPLE
jgi:hypothetical protein